MGAVVNVRQSVIASILSEATVCVAESKDAQ